MNQNVVPTVAVGPLVTSKAAVKINRGGLVPLTGGKWLTTAENMALASFPRHFRIMETDNCSTRVLLVDDFEPWRTHVRSLLGEQPGFKVVAEAADGREAVQRAEVVQPGLILLDIGLPRLSGIDAARRIRQVACAAKILFVSENRDLDIIRAALSAGGHGYVVKSDAASDLLVALRTVVRGEQFVSRNLLDIDHFLTPSLRAPV